METFDKEDYLMPENSNNSLDKTKTQVENNPVEKTKEQIEEELKQENTFIENVDYVSHKNDFKSQDAYVEKLRELTNKPAGEDINKILENKIYTEQIKNLFGYHEKALNAVAQKIKQLGPENYSFKQELEKQLDEISERKSV